MSNITEIPANQFTVEAMLTFFDLSIIKLRQYGFRADEIILMCPMVYRHIVERYYRYRMTIVTNFEAGSGKDIKYQGIQVNFNSPTNDIYCYIPEWGLWPEAHGLHHTLHITPTAKQ